MREDETVHQIAVMFGVHPNEVGQWERKSSEGLVQLFERGARAGRDTCTARPGLLPTARRVGDAS